MKVGKTMINEGKIRKLLGNDYHLSVELEMINGTFEVRCWKLFRRYNDSKMYFSVNNKPIMTSETNTEEELLKFANEHHKYDYKNVFGWFRVVVAFAVFIAFLVNVFIRNKFILVVGIAIDILILIEVFIAFIINEHNYKVSLKQWGNDMEMLLNNDDTKKWRNNAKQGRNENKRN